MDPFAISPEMISARAPMSDFWRLLVMKYDQKIESGRDCRIVNIRILILMFHYEFISIFTVFHRSS